MPPRSGPSHHAPTTLITSLLLVFCVAMLPTFGRPYDAMQGWVDQKAAVEFFNHALAGRFAHAFALNWMGPGWIAAGKTVTWLFGLESRSALLLINRISYLAASFGMIYFVFAHISGGQRRGSWRAFLLAMLVAATLFLSVNFTHFSTVIWSHFIALPFIVWIIVTLGLTTSQRWPVTCFIGLLLGYLATIRVFEAAALSCAGAAWAAYILARRRSEWRQMLAPLTRHGAALAIGLALGYLLPALILGKLHIYIQYSDAVDYPESALYVMRLADLPIKLVQLFIDPCFFAVCDQVVWSKTTPLLAMSDLKSFYWPVFLQAPILVWALTVWLWLLIRHTRRLPALLEDPAAAIAVLAAGGVIIGYCSILYLGSDRLKFGLIREFMSVTFLLALSAIRALYLCREADAPHSPRISTIASALRSGAGQETVLLLLAPVIGILLLQLPIQGDAFFKFPRFSITRIEVTPRCEGNECSLDLAYVTADGRHAWPAFYDTAVVSIQCSEGGRPLLLFTRMADFRYHRDSCQMGAEIILQPTLTGLSLRVRDGYGAKTRIDWRAAYKPGSMLVFAGQNGSAVPYLQEGWSIGEAWGRWTDGDTARMALTLGARPASDLRLRAELFGFVRKANPRIDVALYVNGRKIGDWVVTNNTAYETFEMRIPPDAILEDGTLMLDFAIANAKSPIQLGENTDRRKLGIGLKSLVLETMP